MLVHNFNGYDVVQLEEDIELFDIQIPAGYVDVSNICREENKKIQNYIRVQSSQGFLKVLSKKTGIEIDRLIILGSKKFDRSQIWVHRDIAIDLCCSISPELKYWAMHTLNIIIDGKDTPDNPEWIESKEQLKANYAPLKEAMESINQQYEIIRELEISLQEQKADFYEQRQAKKISDEKLNEQIKDLKEENKKLKARLKLFNSAGKSGDKLNAVDAVIERYEKLYESLHEFLSYMYSVFDDEDDSSKPYYSYKRRFTEYAKLFCDYNVASPEKIQKAIETYKHSGCEIQELKVRIKEQQDLLDVYAQLTARNIEMCGLMRTLSAIYYKEFEAMNAHWFWDDMNAYIEDFEKANTDWRHHINGDPVLIPTYKKINWTRWEWVQPTNITIEELTNKKQ